VAGVEIQAEEEEDPIPKVEVVVSKIETLWNATNVIN
jgi:hypothetical protein